MGSARPSFDWDSRGNEEEKRDVAIIKRVVAHFAVRLMRILNGLFARNNVD